jgi:hypothetical protein
LITILPSKLLPENEVRRPEVDTHTLRNGYSSSSFWKGTLPPYREIIDDNSIASPDSFHSIEDDEERDGNQSTQDDMILSATSPTVASTLV